MITTRISVLDTLPNSTIVRNVLTSQQSGTPRVKLNLPRDEAPSAAMTVVRRASTLFATTSCTIHLNPLVGRVARIARQNSYFSDTAQVLVLEGRLIHEGDPSHVSSNDSCRPCTISARRPRLPDRGTAGSLGPEADACNRGTSTLALVKPQLPDRGTAGL